jgi:dTDP-4-dehydrorhamnose reductase
MKIALSGAAGLIGSRFYDLLKNKYEIIPVSSAFNVDITEKYKVRKFLESVSPAFIVHMAAKTNVDACEEDKDSDLKKLRAKGAYKDEELNIEKIDPLDWKGNPSAFAVNTVGTKNLADFASENDIKIIYLSTDFVFGGDSEGEFTEDDTPSPVNWYGQTKFYGERFIPQNSLVVRISYPYGYISTVRKDFVWTLIDLLKNSGSLKVVSDHIIAPTFIDDVVSGIDFLIENSTTGIVHLTGDNHLSPFEISVAIAREFGLNESKIELTTRAEFYKNRAKRAFKVLLKNDKLKNLGFAMTDFYKALKLIKESQ